MPGFRIFDLSSPSDVKAWLEMWNSWPGREVFGHPEYLRLYAGKWSPGLCAAWQSDGVQILHPFLLRDLAAEPFWSGPHGNLFDATSAYGYAGPYVWGQGCRNSSAARFWSEFHGWARDHRVVSEFVRLGLFPGARLRYPGETWQAAKQIVRPLDIEESALWADFDYKVRKNVNKALRSGVAVEIDTVSERLSDFLRIYNHTLSRRSALASYYFPSEFFLQLQQRMPGQFVYFHAILDGKPVSTELVLISERAVYSFLGGTLEEAFHCRPNDLLKFEIMKWARQHDKSSFVLGGGYHGEDGIYRYKRAFAPCGQVTYFLGGQIFAGELYAALVGARQRFASEHGQDWRPHQGFFPAYRS